MTRTLEAKKQQRLAVCFWAAIASAASLAVFAGFVFVSGGASGRPLFWLIAIPAAIALAVSLVSAWNLRRLAFAGSGGATEVQADELKEQLANFAGAAMDAIISADEGHRIVLFNPAAEAMFGLSAQQAIGQPLEILIPHRSRQAHAEHVRRFMKEGATARRMGEFGELCGLRANGEEFPVEASISRMTYAGGRLHTVIVRDISERVRSERQLRSFIDNAPAAIAMFDPGMRYLAASRRWLEDYGLSEGVTGRSHYDVFPDIPESWKEVHRRALAGETIKADEDCFERANVPAIWLQWEIRPWHSAKGEIGGVILFTEDITARKKAQEALRVSEARFRSVYEHAATGIAIADMDGRFAACNSAFATMLGYGEEELRGLTLGKFTHESDREANKSGIGRLVRREIPSFETFSRCLRKDGSWLWAEKTFSLLTDAGGKPSNILMLVTDKTERQRADERQRMLMRELAHRGKNLLAVIQSIAIRSLSSAPSLDAARTALTGRLQALARTYSNLTDEAFEGARLDEIVSTELQPFCGRTSLRGPKIMLSAKVAQSFTLVIHELATNAAKYGALSLSSGRLDVTWKASGAGAERRFEFEWAESGGPAVSPPSRGGFGTSILSLVAGAEFECTPELIYGSEGFRYRFDTLLSNMGAAVAESPVRRKLKSEALAELYDAWDAGRDGDDGVPDFLRFERDRFASSGGLTLAEIAEDGAVRHIEAGAALMERLGRPLKEAELSSAETGSLAETYRRCVATARPCYESLRFDFGEGDAVSFERLLVPYSAGGGRVTHIAGIAVFRGETKQPN